MISLIFDTETSDLCDFKAPHTQPSQPNIIQLACILADEKETYTEFKTLVDPSEADFDWKMGQGAENIHGISKEMVLSAGISTRSTMMTFAGLLAKADVIVCHNVQFDKKLVMTALHRTGGVTTLDKLQSHPAYCTMQKSTNLCQLPGKFGYKWPKLLELHQFLFGETFDGAHDALEDVRATLRCYREMRVRGVC